MVTSMKVNTNLIKRMVMEYLSKMEIEAKVFGRMINSRDAKSFDKA